MGTGCTWPPASNIRSKTGRVPVNFDNTLSAGMRGDSAVPTLFNGNFDQFIPNKSGPETLGRNTISKEIPGWSLHNGATSTLVSPINNLVEWTQIAQQSPNFANYLISGSSCWAGQWVFYACIIKRYCWRP